MDASRLRVFYSSREQMENNLEKLSQGGWVLVSATSLPNGSVEAIFVRMDSNHHYEIPEHPSLDA